MGILLTGSAKGLPEVHMCPGIICQIQLSINMCICILRGKRTHGFEKVLQEICDQRD